ncbi:MAG: flagellar FlbD family protein [Actinomycetota bacterium]
MNGIEPFTTEGRDVIQLTRLNSQAFALNTDLIERIEETPDTVLTLIDGTRYVVREPVADVIDRVIAFRARVVEMANADHQAEIHVLADHQRPTAVDTTSPNPDGSDSSAVGDGSTGREGV